MEVKRYQAGAVRPKQAPVPQWMPDTPPSTPQPYRAPVQRPTFNNMVTYDTPPPTPTPPHSAYLGDHTHLSPMFAEAEDFRRFLQPTLVHSASRSPPRPTHSPSSRSPLPPSPNVELSQRQLYPPSNSLPYRSASRSPPPATRHSPTAPPSAHLLPAGEGQRRREYIPRQETSAGLGFEIDMDGVSMPVKETTPPALRPLSLTRRRLSLKRLSFGKNGSTRPGREVTQTRTGIMVCVQK